MHHRSMPSLTWLGHQQRSSTLIWMDLLTCIVGGDTLYSSRMVELIDTISKTSSFMRSFDTRQLLLIYQYPISCRNSSRLQNLGSWSRPVRTYSRGSRFSYRGLW